MTDRSIGHQVAARTNHRIGW